MQAQFLTESLSSFNGIFLVVSMVLDPIFAKIIGHYIVLHLVVLKCMWDD